MFVPINIIITQEMTRNTTMGKKMIELGMEKNFFAMYFLEQKKKKEKSFYHHYINILPKDFDNFPVFFNN